MELEDIPKLSKDLGNFDPHVRVNAVISLGKYFLDPKRLEVLPKDTKSDIVNKLLACLEPKEKSMEVKGKTIRTFSQIAKFLSDEEIVQIFKKIINYLADEKSEGKDIYVTCIKTIFKVMPSSCCYTIGKVICPVLTKGIISKNKEINQLCLNTYTDYLNAFDYLLIKENESIIFDKDKVIQAAIENLTGNNDSILKTAAINFSGIFSVVLSQRQLESAVQKILSIIQSSKTLREKIDCFYALKAIANESAIKTKNYIKQILKYIKEYSNINFILNESNGEYDDRNDLAESALSLLETYILKLSNLISGNIDEFSDNSLKLIEYDPNYSYDAQNDDVEMADEYGDDYDMDYEAAVMEDSSWKVRRYAVKVLSAISKSGTVIQTQKKEKIIEKLVEYLKEHDENTKTEIIICLSNYLKTLVTYTDNSNEDDNTPNLLRKKSSINDFIPKIMVNLLNKISKELKNVSSKMNVYYLELLPTMALLAPSEIITHFSNLKDSLEKVCFKESGNTIYFFQFLTALLKAGSYGNVDYTRLYNSLLDYIQKGLNNKFYKICIESLNACYYLFQIFGDNLKENGKNVQKLYNVLLPKFKVNDCDQELKVSLIKTVSQMIACCGSLFNEKMFDELYNIYVDKAKNDHLKSLVITSLLKITNSENELNLTKANLILKDMIKNFLFHSPLNLLSQNLNLLESIFKNYPKSFPNLEEGIVNDLLQIQNEESILPGIYSTFNAMLPRLNPKLINKILNSATTILQNITSSNNTKKLFLFTMNSMSKLDKNSLGELINKKYKDFLNLNTNQIRFLSILVSGNKSDKETLQKCISHLKQKIRNEQIKNVLILIGEICFFSKSNHSELISQLENLAKSAKDEEVIASISICLGKIGLSDPNSFGKYITSKSSDKFYLVSLRIFLSSIIENDQELNMNFSISDDCLKEIYKWVNQKGNMQNSSINNLCGECLGLIAAYRHSFIKEYLNGFNTNDKKQLSTYYYGLKFIFNKKNSKNNQQLDMTQVINLIQTLINGLKDNNYQVRENAFFSLIVAIVNYPNEIKINYVELMKIFEKEHVIDNSLIDESDFGGGLKIRNDKGINIRKGAYNSIKLCVEYFPNKINLSDTIKICIDGLNDCEDIKNIVCGIMIKIGSIYPSSFLSYTDVLCDKLKENKDKIKDINSKKYFVENIKKLLEELKEESEIKDNPKFVNLNNEIQNTNF